MLVAAGDLDPKRPQGSIVARVIGDRPVSLIGLDRRVPADLDGSQHRSVYLPVLRDRLPDVLELFDFAEPSLVTGARETTNVPLQALYLMNSPFLRDRSRSLADRIAAHSDDPDQQVKQAFLLCFSREPDADELKMGLEFLSQNSTDSRPDQAKRRSGKGDSGENGNLPEQRRSTPRSGLRPASEANVKDQHNTILASFCQALLATAEFRNLD